jgi:hypothetical protein
MLWDKVEERHDKEVCLSDILPVLVFDVVIRLRKLRRRRLRNIGRNTRRWARMHFELSPPRRWARLAIQGGNNGDHAVHCPTNSSSRFAWRRRRSSIVTNSCSQPYARNKSRTQWFVRPTHNSIFPARTLSRVVIFEKRKEHLDSMLKTQHEIGKIIAPTGDVWPSNELLQGDLLETTRGTRVLRFYWKTLITPHHDHKGIGEVWEWTQSTENKRIDRGEGS